MNLKDNILLATPDNASMQPHRLDGGECRANLDAIRQLRAEGLVSAVADTRGGFITFSLTDLGKLRKAELVRLQNRTAIERGCDAVGYIWRFMRPSAGRAVEDIIKYLILLGIGMLIGVKLPNKIPTQTLIMEITTLKEMMSALIF